MKSYEIASLPKNAEGVSHLSVSDNIVVYSHCSEEDDFTYLYDTNTQITYPLSDSGKVSLLATNNDIVLFNKDMNSPIYLYDYLEDILYTLPYIEELDFDEDDWMRVYSFEVSDDRHTVTLNINNDYLISIELSN